LRRRGWDGGRQQTKRREGPSVGECGETAGETWWESERETGGVAGGRGSIRVGADGKKKERGR